jgi:hypothetical protein
VPIVAFNQFLGRFQNAALGIDAPAVTAKHKVHAFIPPIGFFEKETFFLLLEITRCAERYFFRLAEAVSCTGHLSCAVIEPGHRVVHVGMVEWRFGYRSLQFFSDFFPVLLG